MFWNKIEQLNQVRPVNTLTLRNGLLQKGAFLRHNRCIELGKRYVAPH